MRRPSPLPAPAPPKPRLGQPAAGTLLSADRSRPAPAASDEAPRGDVDAAGPCLDEKSPVRDQRLEVGGNDAAPPVDEAGPRSVWKAARARRRALHAEMRRFTVRQRRRRALWIGIAASLAILVAGSFGAAYSPLFAVRTIQIAGTHTLDSTALQRALAGQLGRPLPLVDTAQVKAALVGFPLVQSYSLEARPPHELLVRIVERTPVGVLRGPAGYTLVDAAGVALSTTADIPAGQPLLTVGGSVHSEAFRALGQVIRTLPADIRAQVTAASATTPDDVAFTLGATDTTVVWGSADDSAMKALVLAKTMAARPATEVSQYDVSSVPSAVMVR